jgi:hypothetical protein
MSVIRSLETVAERRQCAIRGRLRFNISASLTPQIVTSMWLVPLINAYIATYIQLLPICPIRAERGHLGGFPQLSFAWLEENVYKRDTYRPIKNMV